jgi:hypothetical protein
MPREAGLGMEHGDKLVRALLHQRGGAIEDGASRMRVERAVAKGDARGGDAFGNLCTRRQLGLAPCLHVELVEHRRGACAIDPSSVDEQAALVQLCGGLRGGVCDVADEGGRHGLFLEGG